MIRNRAFVMLAFAVFWLSFPKSGLADHIPCPEWVARLVSVEGRVESLLVHEEEWRPAA
jgi:hypothetical protein